MHVSRAHCRAAAFDASGLSILLVKNIFRWAAASDATGFSTLPASSLPPTNADADRNEPPMSDVYYNDPLSHVSRAHLTSYNSTDTVAMGVKRAHVADAGASVPTGSNGVSEDVVGISGGLWNQQESTYEEVKRGRSPTKRRLGPARHCAPN